MATNLASMTNAELEAESAELYAQRQVVSAEMGAISAELGRRGEAARLARLAAGFTAEELAAMQTIKALGVPSEEAFGSADTRSK